MPSHNADSSEVPLGAAAPSAPSSSAPHVRGSGHGSTRRPLDESLDYHLITDGELQLKLFRNTHNMVNPGWLLRRPVTDATVAFPLSRLRQIVFVDLDGTGYITAPLEVSGIGTLSIDAVAQIASHVLPGPSYAPASEEHLRLADLEAVLRSLDSRRQRWEELLPSTELFDGRELSSDQFELFAEITALRSQLRSRFDLSDDQIVLALRMLRQGHHTRLIFDSVTVVLEH